MIVSKTAVDSNQRWQKAYGDVVKAVGHRYQECGVRVNRVKKGKGNSESTKFKRLLKRIKIDNEIRDGVVETAGVLLEMLP